MKIKVTALAVTALMLLSFNLKAQDEDLKNLGFEEEEYVDTSIPYFGIGGGFTFSALLLNIDDLNKSFANEGFGSEAISGPMFLYGGEGFLVTFWPQNVRLRIFATGGSKEASFDTTINNISYTRTLEYTISYNTGLSIDYAYVPFHRFAIIPGLAIGWGNIKVDLAQGKKFNWVDINTNADSLNFLKRADAKYLFILPGISFEYAVTDFLMFRFNAGYSLSFISKDAWTYNKNSKLSGVPDGINAKGLMLQLGIFAGLFNY